MEEITYQLPSPTGTPYRTPSSTRSRRSQAEDDMSPATTPPPIPEETERSVKRRSNDSINPALDEKISPLDPRRFTPTLHASLVSEILSLRRDIDNRTKDIEKLETNLHQAHQQNESLNANLMASNKERRDIKRQMQMLEGGTFTALNDLGKERDVAVTEATELRRRLGQAQKKAKSQEEVAERTQALWDKDKDAFQTEKRSLETKVQIAEGRLKVVLSEISKAQQPERSASPVRRVESRNSILESPGKRKARRSSANSINSDHHGRVSVLSFANGTAINLADELAFDEEEEDHLMDDIAENGRISPDALPEECIRPASSLSLKARKVLGLPIDLGDTEPREDTDPPKVVQESRRSASYVDTAIQFSPPPSPAPWQRGDGTTDSRSDNRTESRVDSRFDSRTDSRISKRYSKPADLQLNYTNRHSLAGPTPVSPTESMDSRYAPWNHAGPIMVSSACQTIEVLPTPPLTPEKTDGALATIHESAAENVEVKSMSTQTEPVQFKEPKLQKTWQHVSTESSDLQIPLINIIPPASRPATPETHAVVLPPRTRNGGTQVDREALGSYTSSSMQTEEIRVDRRNIMPTSQMPPLPPYPFKAPISNRAIPPRGRKPALPSAMGSQRMNVGISRNPPSTEASSSRELAANLPRSSSLNRAQMEETQPEEEDDVFETDVFNDEDIFTRPTAKFVINRGKMVSSELDVEDSGENHAVSAGEAAALDNLRLSEDSMPPDMKKFFQQGQGRHSPSLNGPRPPPAMKPLRRVPSSKSNNMRRAALISAGSSAHRATGSQSTNASLESANPPPFAIPLRYSSARITKSMSEGGRSSRASSAASPTKTSKLKGKNILRKSRSGPAISPHAQARKSRSRSPPMETRVSIVPEMPTFQMPMPADRDQHAFLNEPYMASAEASAPRPSIATGPRRGTSHTKNNSDVLAIHQTSVVDSIAQTMVGEWMYKYVRRRKSFGMTEKSTDWDNKSVDEISATVTNNGVRHKRWVWLAPYERAVMWSSKQPTSGSALMGGKSGRKLTIKSVLDVKDDNPMPRNTLTGPSFNRSILILTPQRALKFTATSQDRHFVWLTALSFLSHSPLSVNDLNAMPPPPPPDADALYQPPSAPPSLTGSFRRRPIRDSIRIAKGNITGAGKPVGGLRSFTTDGSQHSAPLNLTQSHHIPNRFDEDSGTDGRDYYDPTMDPALPPTVKRYHNHPNNLHARKRSNTAPKPQPPPPSFRIFGGGGQSSNRDRDAAGGHGIVPSLPLVPNGIGGSSSHAGGSSVITSATGSDRGLYTPSLGMPSLPSSRRGSEASASGRPQQGYPDGGYGGGVNNATMRMDAFIGEERRLDAPLPPVPGGGGGGGMGSMNMNMNKGFGNNSSNRGGVYSLNTGGGPVNQWGTLRSGVLKKKDMGYWGIEEGGRGSVSPVDSLMQNEMMLAENGSARPSVDSRVGDVFRGF